MRPLIARLGLKLDTLHSFVLPELKLHKMRFVSHPSLSSPPHLSLLFACCATVVSSWTPFPDSTLNVSLVVSSQPETSGVYLGSPSIVRSPRSRLLIASHDFFGSRVTPALRNTARVFVSSDEGSSWAAAGACASMYWATLFTRPGDAAVYLLGTSDDGNAGAPTGVVLSQSLDDGATWSPVTVLFRDSSSFSTGPTPVLLWAGRLWRAFEHNRGAWGSGYAALVVSAPADAPNLLDAAAWTRSGELLFSAVAGLVPSSWNAHTAFPVRPGYGWLEGNAVQPVDAAVGGVHILLRVNSLPSANKAALLLVANASAAPTFVEWVDFPGGMSKFTVRYDARSKLYVTLANEVANANVSLPPTCGPVTLPANGAPLPCCGFLEACESAPNSVASCVWCHGNSRNTLALAVAPAPGGPWRSVSTLLWDDTGVPAFISELGTGFQYVDFQFDGDDILALVRAGYRGSNNYHNSNRILLKSVVGWRNLL